MSEKGTLFLVATPIGNLEDISIRALKVLKQVDMIAAEDTRHTLKLLNHFEISKTLTSYYEHNKMEKGSFLITKLIDGKNIALVSDAGTPGISDPGEDLVKLAIENGIEVTMIPGPVAAITGLALSGLPAGRFVFEGFLSMNKRVRKERLLHLKNETRTVVFYEAPHKLLRTLRDLSDSFGDRRIVIARELTKKFEQVIRCTLSEAIGKVSNDGIKGELVLILEGNGGKTGNEKTMQDIDAKNTAGFNLQEQISYYIQQGSTKKEAIKKAAETIGISKREAYNCFVKATRNETHSCGHLKDQDEI